MPEVTQASDTGDLGTLFASFQSGVWPLERRSLNPWEPLGCAGGRSQPGGPLRLGREQPLSTPCSACSGPVSRSREYFFQFPFCNPFKKTQAQPKQGTSVGSMFPAANRIFRSPGLLCPPQDFCWVGVGQARGCGTAPTHNVPAASSGA